MGCKGYLLQVICVSSLASISLSYLPDRYGRLRVSYETVFVGETLQFHCQITDQSLDADPALIYIRRANSRASSQAVGETVFQNESSVTVNLTMRSVNDSGVYYCMVPTRDKREVGLGNSLILVDYPLKKVDNVDCILDEYVTFSCTYELPVKYTHPEHVLGEVLHKLPDYDEQEVVMFNKSSSRTFTMPSGTNLYVNSSFRILLSYQGRDDRETTSEEFLVNPMRIALPSKVRRIQITEVRETSANLSWRMPDNVKLYVCNISYTATWTGESEREWMKVKFNSEETTGSVRLQDLIPGTKYILDVRCRPCADRYGDDIGLTPGEEFGFYSQSSQQSMKTLDSKPGLAPEICPAVTRRSSTEFNVYWKSVPARYFHGTFLHYLVSVEELHSISKEKVLTKSLATNTSKILSYKSPENMVYVKVQLVNNIGMSPSSSIKIVPENEEPAVPRFWVTGDWSSRFIEYRWDKVAAPDARCMLVWCKADFGAQSCEGPINWTTVSCRDATHRVDTGYPLNQHSLRVGLAVKDVTQTGMVHSSIKWDYCIYKTDQVPPAPKGFRLSEIQTPLTLHVMWSQFDCREDPVFISNYVLSYCKGDTYCEEPEQIVVVDGSPTSHVIQSLLPVQYLVTLRAVSSSGRGPESEALHFLVHDDVKFVVIAVATAVGLVILIVVPFCIYIVRLYMRKNMLIAIDVPGNLLGEKHPDRSKSNESHASSYKLYPKTQDNGLSERRDIEAQACDPLLSVIETPRHEVNIDQALLVKDPIHEVSDNEVNSDQALLVKDPIHEVSDNEVNSDQALLVTDPIHEVSDNEVNSDQALLVTDPIHDVSDNEVNSDQALLVTDPIHEVSDNEVNSDQALLVTDPIHEVSDNEVNSDQALLVTYPIHEVSDNEVNSDKALLVTDPIHEVSDNGNNSDQPLSAKDPRHKVSESGDNSVQLLLATDPRHAYKISAKGVNSDQTVRHEISAKGVDSDQPPSATNPRHVISANGEPATGRLVIEGSSQESTSYMKVTNPNYVCPHSNLTLPYDV